ncbi:MAG TPA: methyltransferase domain-containing protein [Gemmatimonadaceae bacterium]
MTSHGDLSGAEATLRRRFRVVETSVRVGRRALSILHPESAEDLIDERDFDLDERLPYWAELWPSARVLAERVATMPGTGRSLLELGCGSGLVATSASLAGFDVTVSDYYDDAVLFARVNAKRNGAAPVRGMLLDWRNLPSDLGRFDVVVASDVLYERPYGALIARVLDATLGHNGTAVVADPGRVGRSEFIRALDPLGLRVTKQADIAFREGPIRQTITLFEIARVAR